MDTQRLYVIQQGSMTGSGSGISIRVARFRIERVVLLIGKDSGPFPRLKPSAFRYLSQRGHPATPR